MNDGEITTRLRESLRRQAGRAPSAAGLDAAVRRRARRRGIRRWVTGVGSGLGAVTIAAVLTGTVTQPTTGEQFGADTVSVCFGLTGDRVTDLWVSESSGDSVVATEQAEVVAGDFDIRHRVIGGDYDTIVSVWPRSAGPFQLRDAEEISVDGRGGMAGTAAGTELPAAVFDSGVGDMIVLVQVSHGDPSVAELAAWVESFDVHDTTRPCEAAG